MLQGQDKTVLIPAPAVFRSDETGQNKICGSPLPLSSTLWLDSSLMRILLKIIVGLIVIALGAWFIHGLVVKPSLDRNWSPDQKILPRVSFTNDGKVRIKNVRNINYRSTTDYDVRHYDRTYDLDELESAWFLVEPFGSFGAAHTLMSFGFANGDYVAISAEIRKEAHELFSPFAGMVRQYELMYVIADERDVIRLRTNFRKDVVRLYPIRTDKKTIRKVFVDALRRAEKLAKEPEFYNTLTNNCTTNIADHVRKFSDKSIPWWDYRYLLPETVDAIAYEQGLIDTDLPLDRAREHFLITKRAQAITDIDRFSELIRVR